MPIVDLSFPVHGTSVARDHGYPLYAAITSAFPLLHGAQWLGIHPINASLVGGALMLDRKSSVRLRIPSERISEVLALAGASLIVAGSRLRLGVPTVWSLRPSPALDARIVVLKLTHPPTRTDVQLGRLVLDTGAFADRYRLELARQMDRLGVHGEVELCGRRSLAIKGRRVLGYSVRVTGLAAVDSITVQERGLGGRRAFGCGVFRPTRS